MADKFIIYEQDDLSVALVFFSQFRDPMEVGEKTVPAGKNFWIVEASDFPGDDEDFEAWEIDYDTVGTPDGVGENEDES